MRPHGLKGEVVLALDPQAPEDLASVKTLFVEVHEQLLPFFVESVSLKGSKAYLKLEEVNNREEAEKISKSPTFLPKSSRLRSMRGEFYDDEITGYEVADTILGSLGKITGVVQAGPNKLLAVGYGEKEVLIPVNSPFIDAINKSKRQLTVTLPDGFLDI
jgi:16S rRNA processing protein RimM